MGNILDRFTMVGANKFMGDACLTIKVKGERTEITISETLLKDIGYSSAYYIGFDKDGFILISTTDKSLSTAYMGTRISKTRKVINIVNSKVPLNTQLGLFFREEFIVCSVDKYIAHKGIKAYKTLRLTT